MKAPAVLTALRRLWSAPQEATSQTVDKYPIASEASVRRTLERLASKKSMLSLQTEDGSFDHAARLLSGSSSGVALELLPPVRLPAVPAAVNVTVSHQQGVLLFSLHGLQQDAQGLLHAPWPAHLLQVQSRRHFRVTGLNGRHFHADLELPQGYSVLRLRDLSESGASFDVAAPGPASGTSFQDVCLRLDGQAVTVPTLQVMHSHAHGSTCTVGAHFEGLGPTELRRLRRWIAALQAAMAGLPPQI